MELNEPVIITTSFLIFAMLIVSFTLNDLEHSKPARFAFRVFFLSHLLFNCFLTASLLLPKTEELLWIMVDLLSDISLAVMYISLIVAFSWRSKEFVNIKYLFVLSVTFILANVFTSGYSLIIANIYGIICLLISVYYLLNRKQDINQGDKGLVITLSLYILILVYKVLFTNSRTFSDEMYNQLIIQTLFFTPAFLALITIFIFLSYMKDIQKILLEEASTDSMTGLYNRRFVIKQGKKLLSSALRHEHTMALIMCDIDKFKSVNDTFGHSVGDQAIVEFANILEQTVREEDIVARIGGEEFVILFPETELNEALDFAEKIRANTQAISINTQQGELKFTASFGVSNFDDMDIKSNFKKADKALYRAKESGRNKVVLFNENS